MNDEGAPAGEGGTNPGAGGTSQGGVGGTSGATSGGTGGLSATCRLYPTRYLWTGLGVSEQYECAWDGPLLTMRCRGGVSPGVETTETWASLEDAVRHDTPVGNYTSVSSTSLAELGTTTCQFTFTMPRDSSGRRTGQEGTPGPLNSCGTLSYVYDAWDTEGRPTHGLAHDVGLGDCVGQDVIISYDDADRTVTRSQSGGSGCFEATYSSTFDAAGLPVRFVADETTFEYQVIETSEICVD